MEHIIEISRNLTYLGKLNYNFLGKNEALFFKFLIFFKTAIFKNLDKRQIKN